MTPLRPLVAAAVVLTLTACGSPKPAAEPAAAPSASPSPRPAPTPSGDRGADWHAVNNSAPWEGHVIDVLSAGPLIVVHTDLAVTDAVTAVQICQGGHAYLQTAGAPTASVWVYSGRVKLAESKNGAPCQASL